MNWFINFCLGSCNSWLLFETISSFNIFKFYRIDDILSAVVALIGGIISTIIINIIRSRYPNLFKPKTRSKKEVISY